jgi:two-component system phosphate regulon sensor histidine kinase PhoR
MKKRIFWSIIFSSLLTIILTTSLIITALYSDFTSERKLELATECSFAATALGKTDIGYLTAIGRKSSDRITLIGSDGTVLYDSFADAKTLDNHLDRPEIYEAMKNGSGEATRLSDTIGEQTYYYALRLDDGNILRISTTTRSIFGIINNAAAVILLIVLLAVICAAFTALILTKAIVTPINKLDLDTPLSNNTYDELSSLLLRMDKQNKKIAEQIGELNAKQNELNAITESMSEALVIFGGNKHILFANKSAYNLFGNNNAKNIGYLEFCRDVSYTRTVEAAFEGRSAGDKISKNGRIYQLSVNPVLGNKAYAAVLFAVDITEKEQSEKMRREFSANVSHELKTPLTSISGCAEIMQNGIAKEEDYPRFIGQIYTESKRLITLIDDIIKLSRLDEDGLKKEFEPVDLYSLSEKVISSLKSKAEAAGIGLSLEGESHLINGINGTLYEMVYNLCDNAITYNKTGGTVTVNVSASDGSVVLSVRDTGIGIAPEHQARIFERFYRVDKSRSKETGGTGLGLSIVKHGAILHNAAIKLESEKGKGTTISIIFKTA